MARLGRVPQLDDVIEVELAPTEDRGPNGAQTLRVSMRVSEMDGRRIAWLDLTKLDTDQQAAAAPRGEPQADDDRAKRQDLTVRRHQAEASQAADETTPGI